jgi:hypothetical protein
VNQNKVETSVADPAAQRLLEQYEAQPSDIVTNSAGEIVGEAPPDSPDYTVTWDMPDTSRERMGLLIAGGLAFLAPFVGFAVAAHTARKHAGLIKPVGAGALTFFALRAASVGVLHYSGNLPNVSAATALGATLPQVPRRNYQLGATRGRAPCTTCH